MGSNVTFDELWEELKNESEESKDFYCVTEAVSDIIGDIVRARVSRGWTQRELAQACGVKQSAIARMERFQVMPRLDTVIKIAQKLNLQICASPVLSVVNETTSITVTTVATMTSNPNVYRSYNQPIYKAAAIGGLA